MTITDLVVLAGAVVVSAGLGWFFFGTKRPSQHAVRSGQSQQVTVIVRGGYTSSRIEAVAGVPLRITFDRREGGDCSSRVVFPDLGSPARYPRTPRPTSTCCPSGSVSTGSPARWT